MSIEPRPFSCDLLAWYDRNARSLPWRVSPQDRATGVLPDAYRVWLSEVMLQQTTVATVKAYFARFVNRWPTVGDLADAPQADVLGEWAGLGYYARARNLHACAKAIVADHNGKFPPTATALRELPGIGDYTSAAIAAIAFDEPAAVVDGNVERVITRIRTIDTPLPTAKGAIRKAVATVTPRHRAGDFAQAMMDLGATLCTPKRPNCLICPVLSHCRASAQGTPESYPVKKPKAERAHRRGAAFVAIRASDGAVFLRRREESGMLGGMSEPPTSAWSARADGETGVGAAPFHADWRDVGRVDHGFTHFTLTLDVFAASVSHDPPVPGWWSPADRLAEEALPTLMKKVLTRAMEGTPPRPGHSPQARTRPETRK